jgi:hypothetical protein
MAAWYGYIDNSTATTAGSYGSSSWYTSTASNSNTTYYTPTWYRTDGTYVTPTYYGYTYTVPALPESIAEKAARLKREAEWAAGEAKRREEQKKLDAEKEAAINKAEELLKAHIGQQKYNELYRVGHIELDSEKYHGRKYRVKSNANSRIEVVEDGKVVDELCIISTVECPRGDLLLSKVVMLESAEEAALKIANHLRRVNV